MSKAKLQTMVNEFKDTSILVSKISKAIDGDDISKERLKHNMWRVQRYLETDCKNLQAIIDSMADDGTNEEGSNDL